MLWGVLVFAFTTSCTKEGVYTPSKKIRKVYHSTSSIDKYLSQSWEWNGKLLEYINYYSSDGSLSWTENFTYDGKRLIQVDNYLGSEYITYEYDGKKLKSANYFFSNSLGATIAYTYSDNKLEKMIITYYDYYMKHNGNLLKTILPLPSEVTETINKALDKVCADRQEKEVYTFTYQFTWSDTNVSKIEATEDGRIITANLQYDAKNNPFKGFHDLNSDVESNPILCLSKNNVTRMILVYSDGDSEVQTYTYSYNSDNYPTMSIMRYADDDDYQSVYYYDYD